jgi:drug/metabolite transporter superfamily protein YnfA
VLRTTLLFVFTAVAEIVGCYLPYLVLKGGKTPLLLIPAALSLAGISKFKKLPATDYHKKCLAASSQQITSAPAMQFSLQINSD